VSVSHDWEWRADGQAHIHFGQLHCSRCDITYEKMLDTMTLDCVAMSGQTRAADDADVIKVRLNMLAYERRMAPFVANCAAMAGKSKSDCTQCVGMRCLMCKTYQDKNQDGAKGCILCTKPDGTYNPCPPA
jgi:hypothetical protein